MTLPIDTGKPIPKLTPGRKRLYPWRDMAVGQSFFCHKKAAYSGWGRSQGLKFVIRTVVEDGVHGYRIFRVA